MQKQKSNTIFMDSRVLITGGCGFIGSHLVETLVTQGAIVTVIDNLQAGYWSNIEAVSNEVCSIEGDIRDSTLVGKIVEKVKPRYIFHLAANASVPRSVEDPVYDFETSSQGTFALLNALRLFGGCQKIVVASSGAVYGQPVTFPITEGSAVSPISPYGAGKVNAEISAKMFQAVYGLPVVIARIFNTYGPRMARFVILDFLRKLHNNPGMLEILGNGRQIRDFTYVSDTVNGLLLLADRGKDGEAYNISSGVSHSVTELAHKLLTNLGLNGQTQLTYTGESWVGDAQRWEVSIEKIGKIGYKPQITLVEGLQQTIQWFCATEGLQVPS